MLIKMRTRIYAAPAVKGLKRSIEKVHVPFCEPLLDILKYIN